MTATLPESRMCVLHFAFPMRPCAGGVCILPHLPTETSSGIRKRRLTEKDYGLEHPRDFILPPPTAAVGIIFCRKCPSAAVRIDDLRSVDITRIACADRLICHVHRWYAAKFARYEIAKAVCAVGAPTLAIAIANDAVHRCITRHRHINIEVNAVTAIEFEHLFIRVVIWHHRPRAGVVECDPALWVRPCDQRCLRARCRSEGGHARWRGVWRRRGIRGRSRHRSIGRGRSVRRLRLRWFRCRRHRSR